MFLEAIVLAFLVAFLRGGRLREDFGGLRYMWLAPVAFVVQRVSAYTLGPGIVLPVLTVMTYGMLLYFAYANLNNQGVRLLLIGMVLNGVVILANGGYIPVDMAAARQYGVPGIEDLDTGPHAKHVPLAADSKLKFLGDVIPLPSPPFLIPRIISIGDLFAVAGMFFLVQHLMGRPIALLRSEGRSK
jgi:hypothetical protein